MGFSFSQSGRLASAVGFVLLVLITASNAQEISRTVGGTQLHFPIPSGQCLVEENNPRDVIFIEIMTTIMTNAKSKWLLLTMECARLATWRAGVDGEVFDYAAYYIREQDENTIIKGYQPSERKMFCNAMRKQGDASLLSVKDKVAAIAKELNTSLAVSSTKMIGVVDEDDHGCYSALLIGFQSEAGVLRSVLITTTVVRGKPLFSGIYHKYNGYETIERSIHEAKAIATVFDEKNP